MNCSNFFDREVPTNSKSGVYPRYFNIKGTCFAFGVFVLFSHLETVSTKTPSFWATHDWCSLRCNRLRLRCSPSVLHSSIPLWQLGLLHFSKNVIWGSLEHPSGQLRPSASDIKLTKSLVKFGRLIDIQVLDHLIITANNYFSFVDEGILYD
jgi:hypothetical protein